MATVFAFYWESLKLSFPRKIVSPKSLYILLRMLSISEVGKVYPHVPAVLFFPCRAELK